MDWDKALNTNLMIILKICQKEPLDIISMTPRGTLGLCCVHIAQLMTNLAPGILQRVSKSQKVHLKSRWIAKLCNINLG